MLQNLLKSKKLQKGFTIIEVMIVLAIAGLILVVVLIAIPQLQRNQRNENRRSVASRIVTEVNAYAGNNNGAYPVADVASGQTNFGTPATAAGFFNRYLGCNAGACDANIDDPRSGSPVGTGTTGVAANDITTVAAAGSVPALASTAGSIAYATGAICSGEIMTTTGASQRSFAFQIRLEGGAIFCSDNT